MKPIMEMMTEVSSIPIKIVVKDARLIPSYQTAGAAGADIYAFVDEEVVISPGRVACIPTGLFVEIPDGFEAQIRPRSGLALKYHVTVLNAPGTIDADYRGEIGVVLINHGQSSFTVVPLMRVAQMVIAPVVRARFVQAAQLDVTQRGGGGFGHTGYSESP